MPKTITIPNASDNKKGRIKIVVGINTLTSVRAPAYVNHVQLFYRLGRSYPNIDFCLVAPPRMSIDRMRNLAADTALDIEAKYLLFIDDDVLIPTPFDFLRKLMALKAPIAAADVIIRGWPFMHMLFQYNKKKTGMFPLKSVPSPLGKLSVDAVGFSCCLIETSLLAQLTKPYFVTGTNNTEDIYFCLKARDKFPSLKILADTSIQCAHLLSDEMIEPANLLSYRAYFDKQFKPEKPSKTIKEHDYRGGVYYNIVKAQLDAENAKTR